MNRTSFESLPTVLRDVIADVTPFFEQLETGQFGVALAGSISKGTWDERSDIDFRLYHEYPLPRPAATSPTWREYFAVVDEWGRRGVRIDGIWSRTVAEVEAKLNAWLRGDITPEPIQWTIWGYHILPDISHQLPVLDPYGIIASWHERVAKYPDAVRESVLTKHLASVRYWRSDYHYQAKVERNDVIFLASLSARLVHDLLQIVCAINRVPFPGDGNNLRVVDDLLIQPDRFHERAIAVLYPGSGETVFRDQYEALMALIDDTEALVAARH